MKLVFGDIVVIEENQIGVVVKNWGRSSNGGEPKVEVYVRSYNAIVEYPISRVERYQVRHKYLEDEELEYQANAEREE
jgi:hypothetical protein